MGGVELSDRGPNIPLSVSHLLPCASRCKKKKKKKKKTWGEDTPG